MAIAKPNLCGLFANDWATQKKVSLLAETFTVFSSLQKIASEGAAAKGVSHYGSSSTAANLLPSLQTLQYYHRISNLYREAFKKYLQSLESSADADDENDLEVAQSISTVLHFAETLYIPADGKGVGVVGEEILHWLNSFDFAPRTQDGQAIAQSAVPYEHASFWDYILRCILRGFHTSAASLLSSLANDHPSKALRRIAEHACRLLSTMPRSTSFTIEHDFLSSHRRWLGNCRSLLSKLEQELDEMEMEMERNEDGGRSRDDVEDERLEFEAQFRCLLELMIGVKERVFEACEDWREALGAWGMLVQPSLKRDDVPQVIKTILDAFPIDATLSMDVILSSLARGDVFRSCQAAQDFDPWLAAHMTDLLERAGILIEGEEDEGSMESKGLQLRRKAIEEYAETLLDDQGLWRLAVDYLAYCGPSARRRMRYILLDVPLSGPQTQASRPEVRRAEDIQREAMDTEADMQTDDPDEAAERRQEQLQRERETKRISDEYEMAMEVIQTCIDLDMQDEARAVCKRMAMEMTKQKRMGPALAYCVRARDVRQIRRIVDDILWLYVEHGLEEFCSAVDSIPMALLTDPTAVKDSDQTGNVSQSGLDVLMSHDINLSVTSRLVFLARYRDFHRFYSQGELRSAATLLVELVSSNTAPEPFRAILLIDAIPLLQNEQGMLLTSDESFELLRVLDTIAQSAASNARQAHHYLGMLEALLTSESSHKARRSYEDEEEEEKDGQAMRTKHNVRSASRRLDILRLALARQLAQSVLV